MAASPRCWRNATSLPPFFVSKFEVTQAQWLRAMGSNPALYRIGPAVVVVSSRERPVDVMISPLNPVESVSWQECATCAERLDLRLPSEVEWEYAARAGAAFDYGFGDLPECLGGKENVLDLSHTPRAVAQGGLDLDDGQPLHAPVGSFAANPFGLFDMLGNVSEWCADLFRSSDPIDGEAWRRVFRGGNWYVPVRFASCTYRQFNNPRSLNQVLGARFARDLR